MLDLLKAKHQLRIVNDDSDEIILRKMREAQAVVLDYLKIAVDTYSYANSPVVEMPLVTEAAILMVLDNLYFRPEQEVLTTSVMNLLMRSRDPAIA